MAARIRARHESMIHDGALDDVFYREAIQHERNAITQATPWSQESIHHWTERPYNILHNRQFAAQHGILIQHNLDLNNPEPHI